MDREGATDLVVDLIMKNYSSRVFQETVELGIALLQGGNTGVQHSFYLRITTDKNAEKFFKVFYDRMQEAQTEIRSTMTSSTTEQLVAKSQEEAKERKAEAAKAKGLYRPISNGI